MIFNFDKVDDTKLIGPSIFFIYKESEKIISTSKLIKQLRNNSIIPNSETIILKKRKDDIFSQKVRNLISHKILEKNNLAFVEKNLIKLSSYGKKIGTHIDNLQKKNNNHTTIAQIQNNKKYQDLILQAKLNINFPSYLLDKIKNFELSNRLKKVLLEENRYKYVGDLLYLNRFDLLKNRSVGKKTVDELESFLKSLSLSFENKLLDKWSNIDEKELANLVKLFDKEKSKNFSINLDELIRSESEKFIAMKPKVDSARISSIIDFRFALNGTYKSLEDIASQYNVTRERIRQIQTSFTKHIKEKSEIKLAVKKLDSYIKKLTPLTQDVLYENLKNNGFISSYKSFEAMRNILTLLFNWNFDIHLFLQNKVSPSYLINNNSQKKIINKVYTYSRKYSNKYSFCNFENLIFDAFKTKNYSKFSNIKKSLQNDELYLWFDDDNFSILDLSKSRQIVLNTLKKLLKINKKITFETLSESLLNFHRAGHVPPQKLFNQILNLHNFKYDSEFIYYSGHEIELASNDIKIVKMFHENGYFLSFWQCWDLAKKYDIKEGSLGAYLYARDIVKKDEDVFYIFGTPFDKKKYDVVKNLALATKIKHKDIDLNIEWEKNTKSTISVDFILRKNIRRIGTMYIPSGFSKLLDGKYTCIATNSDIFVAASQIWGLRECLANHPLDKRVKMYFSLEPKVVKVKSLMQ